MAAGRYVAAWRDMATGRSQTNVRRSVIDETHAALRIDVVDHRSRLSQRCPVPASSRKRARCP